MQLRHGYGAPNALTPAGWFVGWATVQKWQTGWNEAMQESTARYYALASCLPRSSLEPRPSSSHGLVFWRFAPLASRRRLIQIRCVFYSSDGFSVISATTANSTKATKTTSDDEEERRSC